MKDYVDTIGVWSNEWRVFYNGIQDPYEYAGLDGPETIHSSSAMSDATYLDAETAPAIQRWWPVDADRLTLSRKLEILIPIKETVMELTHKFRWKENDPFEPGDNRILFAEADKLERNLANKESQEETKKADVEKAENDPSNQNLSKANSLLKKTESAFLPKDFAIYQNYPNPFNPSTTITYDIAKSSFVKITIFNTLGQTIRWLYEGTKSQGRYDIVWDGKNDQGVQVPSGMYIYRLEAGDFVQSKKMMLVK